MMSEWRTIESAPKDGTRILLLGKVPTMDEARLHVETAYSTEPERRKAAMEIIRPDMCPTEVGYWDSDGTSWVDVNGSQDGDAHHLEVTGVWLAGGGWFQPNEVTHWMPLPDPPIKEPSDNTA